MAMFKVHSDLFCETEQSLWKNIPNILNYIVANDYTLNEMSWLQLYLASAWRPTSLMNI
jgi:hypothetical protein